MAKTTNQRVEKGIPFDGKIPAKKPVGFSSLTEEELIAELEKDIRIS